MIFTLANFITFLRAPLALLFIYPSTEVRVWVIILAMITDSIDGYVARKRNTASQFGAFLDPLLDKFFVYTVIATLVFDKGITPYQLSCLISRDIGLLAFILFLLVQGIKKIPKFQSNIWGKTVTAIQFIALIFITLQIPIPSVIFSVVVLCAFLFVVELFFQHYSSHK